MMREEINKINVSADEKIYLADKKPGKYLIRAIMAGFYLVIAIMLSYTLGALTTSISGEVSKILAAMTFSIALVLICFLGGELFTGNNLVMGIAFYDKRHKINSVLKVWLYSYIGNFIGCLIIGYIFIRSGSGNEMFPNYLEGIINTKISMNTLQLLLRGILCNFIVCISVFCNIKMKSESGKMMAMFWLIFTFVIAGFEHSIANMGIFSIGYFTLGSLPIGGVLNNMFWVTIGNIIGGAILYGFPLYHMCTE